MSERVDMRLYTARQLKDWLFCGRVVEGLSEELIDKTRAYSLVTNPYVTDDMSLVSALFVDGNVGAYTYVFPDRMEKPKRTIYWNTTLYVNPKYEGRGYAYCVIAAICELYGNDYFDLDAAEASVENLKYQGLTVKYLSQYMLRQKTISGNNLKAKAARVWEHFRLQRCSKEVLLRRQLAQCDYELQYVNYVDDETYAFIKSHSEADLFLRRQETFNWVLQYPFMQESPLQGRVRHRCQFSSAIPMFRMYGIVVRKQEAIVGFIVMRATQDEWSVKYLYYDLAAEKDVFLAVTEHLLAVPRSVFFTADKQLHDFVAQYNLFAHDMIYHKSFAYPANFEYDEICKVQAGDGDNVT